MSKRTTNIAAALSVQPDLFSNGMEEGALDIDLGHRQCLSRAMQNSGKDRYQIAAEMSRLMATTVSKEMLDKYAASDPHNGMRAVMLTHHSVDAIKATCGRYRIASGRSGLFEKGQVSWNKGVKGYMGANVTSFKKGAAPPNRKPLWSERLDLEYGFIVMKVPETDPYTGFPTRYKSKHVWIWEQLNGPLPAASVIIFLDSDRLNFAPENLLCIHRNVLLVLNLHKYAEAPPELKPSILALAKLEAAAGIRTVRAAGAGRKRRAS